MRELYLLFISYISESAAGERSSWLKDYLSPRIGMFPEGGKNFTNAHICPVPSGRVAFFPLEM